MSRLPLVHFLNNSGVLKFVLTSHPYSTIWRGLERLKQCVPIIEVTGENSIDSISREINIFIEDNIHHLGPALRLSESEKKLLRKAITTVPHQTYLWANLVFEAIRNNVDITRDELQQYVHTLPRTVEAAYDMILGRSSDPSQARRLLGIVIAAARPLSLNEIAVALAIGESHRKHDDLLLETEDRFSRTVRDLSGCFIRIVESKIYLLHETARDFLIKTQNAQTLNRPMNSCLQWKQSLDLVESHRILANVCIWYLLLDPLTTYHHREDISDSTNVSIDLTFLRSKETSTIYPFLKYSAQNWLIHYHQARFQKNESIQNSMLRLLDSVETRMWYNIWTSLRTECPEFYSQLARASCFGLEEVVRQLLDQRGPDIESKDTSYDNQTPLMWAAQEGYNAIVGLLLDGGADVNLDYLFDTPLIKAVKNKHAIVASTLLTRGADVEAADINGKTPLFHAATLKRGHNTQSCCNDLAKLLLERGADIQARDITGRTPLSYAAEEGCDAAVRLLLENGADIDLKDNEGRTALSYAAEGGHDIVTQILLEQSADVLSRDNQKRRPLYYAIKWQHSGTVQVLLDRIPRLSRDDSVRMLTCAMWGDQHVIRDILQAKTSIR
ncbi:ankyrin repeat-containing domain protein [Daldinia caldariorum]|uniref:ankyrin repeat-containing domain protein n=1 Tax=Daldinia caldariorum TaxID=326644 RepID=UPI002007E021|nr:ankyrin repeat-containing domain protein [Daldinia caldariorum]KAI1472908.1 ankyrin repeat-containing domain protein [Daldinia caldariorum]